MKIKTLLLSTLFFFNSLYATNIEFHGNVNNSTYAYEDTASHLKIYQSLAFNIKDNWKSPFSLNVGIAGITDFDSVFFDKVPYEEKIKVYDLNFKIKKVLNQKLDLTFGRQFLHPGIILGGLDGLYAKYRIQNKISLSIYTGVESHFNRLAKIYKIYDGITAGALLNFNNYYSTKLQLLYLNKTNDIESYWQITGLNLSSNKIPKTNINLKLHYDLLNSRFHKILLNSKYSFNKKLSVSAEFKNQYPQIYANSFFTIFDIKAYKQYKFASSYNLYKNYYINSNYALLKFDTELANKLLLSISDKNGSIGLIYESGYAGNQLGVIADYAYNINDNFITSASIDYSMYKTEEIYEYDNQLANAIKFSYFYKQVIIDLEYQWLFSKFKESDSRILNRIRYSW